MQSWLFVVDVALVRGRSETSVFVYAVSISFNNGDQKPSRKSNMESNAITDGVTLTEAIEQIETTGLKSIDIAPA